MDFRKALMFEHMMNLRPIDQARKEPTAEMKQKEVQVAAENGLLRIPIQLNIMKEKDDGVPKILMFELRMNIRPIDQGTLDVLTAQNKTNEVQEAAENGSVLPIQLNIKKEDDGDANFPAQGVSLKPVQIKIKKENGGDNVVKKENGDSIPLFGVSLKLVQLNIQKEDDINVKKEKDDNTPGIGESLKFQCKTCVVVCNGEAAWKAHVVGKKHQAKNRQMMKATKGCYRCSYCDVDCVSWVNMGKHLIGKKHVSKIQEVISSC